MFALQNEDLSPFQFYSDNHLAISKWVSNVIYYQVANNCSTSCVGFQHEQHLLVYSSFRVARKDIEGVHQNENLI